MLSIALDSSSSRNRIEGSGFIRGMSCVPIFESPVPGRSMAAALPGDRRFPSGNLAMPSSIQQQQKPQSQEEEQLDSCSSSIGRNSDLSCRSSDGEDSGEIEVQSSYKGPLDTMDALEEVLPIRRGISNFYRGKSKSFASLADAAASPIRELAKPENPYTRKRKNLLACNYFWDRNRGSPLRSNGGGISKRPTHSSRSTLALAVAMSSSESNNTSENSNSNSSSPTRFPPPLHPQAKQAITNASLSELSPPRRNFSSWRSFSLADLQCAASTSSAISNRD
ncbi:uncharacterized protein LOC122666638 [Telopea speciosissima]|uniref:uncharacterized protein LOC122666638 n=1 Tax=Telopea speciosissima TaxID=54955 RepID=UPI001CC810C8|nr:uncharacterized protein LOC122666638 [Telopea speciosissima]